MPILATLDPFSARLDRADIARNTAFQQTDIYQGGGSLGYYNSGFLGGLGTFIKSAGPYIAAAGSIAAEVLPAIYHTGADQTAAAGPTAHPVAQQAAKARSQSMVGRAVQAAEHPIQTTEQLLGLGPKASTGRYGSPGQKGYHMVKKGPHAGMWVRNRHRNPANIHALRRSLSRIHSFEKIARKVVHFTHPRAHHGAAIFKRRKRRS